jgi:hypothetical protein
VGALISSPRESSKLGQMSHLVSRQLEETQSGRYLLFFLDFVVEVKYNKCLPTQTSLYISFKHILKGITSFMGSPNSLRILYSTSLLT